MTLPSSGAISLSQVRDTLGIIDSLSMNDSRVRTLAFGTGTLQDSTINFSDLYYRGLVLKDNYTEYGTGWMGLYSGTTTFIYQSPAPVPLKYISGFGMYDSFTQNYANNDGDAWIGGYGYGAVYYRQVTADAYQHTISGTLVTTISKYQGQLVTIDIPDGYIMTGLRIDGARYDPGTDDTIAVYTVNVYYSKISRSDGRLLDASVIKLGNIVYTESAIGMYGASTLLIPNGHTIRQFNYYAVVPGPGDYGFVHYTKIGSCLTEFLS